MENKTFLLSWSICVTHCSGFMNGLDAEDIFVMWVYASNDTYSNSPTSPSV